MSASGGGPDPVVLRLRGDVDALSQQEYRALADDLVSSSGGDRLVVDMTEVDSIDSSGLGLLVHIQSITRNRDITMVLKNVPPRAEALLRRTGLNRVFQIDGA